MHICASQAVPSGCVSVCLLKMLRRLKYTVQFCEIRNLYTTIVLPSLDYCDVVWAGYVYKDCCKDVGRSANIAAHAIVEHLTDHQQLHWEPNWAANFREKTGTLHCNLGVSMSQARTFPLLICTIYFSLSRNSTSITLDWVKMALLSPEHIWTWCLGPFVIKELLYFSSRRYQRC